VSSREEGIQIQSLVEGGWVCSGAGATDAGRTIRPELVRSRGFPRSGLFSCCCCWGSVAERGPPPRAPSPGAGSLRSGE
jgi:hypothetical protein